MTFTSFRFFFRHLHLLSLVLFLLSCDQRPAPHDRPLEPWAFRSVLDKKPRILTVALDSACYIAYDLSTCTLYKAWKGGVLMEGAAYSDKKNVQPTSWGASYIAADSASNIQWVAEKDGKRESARMVHKGHVFRDDQIHLKFWMILSSGDTIRIEERPEFVRNGAGDPGLERLFTLSGVPDDVTVSLQSNGERFPLKSNKSTTSTIFFQKLPEQSPPKAEAAFDHRGRYWMEKSDCMTCHEVDQRTVGPAFQEVAQKYPREKTAIDYLIRKVQQGGSGVWGPAMMNPHPNLAEKEIREMINYIFSLKPAETSQFKTVSGRKEPVVKETQPGHGAPLAGVHPSFDLQTIRKENFKPRVGGLAFLPDGRLLVTTWDTMGGVYVLDGVETGDTSQISVKRIASGLAEPLGIEVVDGEIYVLQKHELTRLVDLDGDEITDEYEAICNSWGVTSDFHEFSFGLVYKDGYFYAALSMAMRLMSHERQHPDRGRAIRISKDGTYETLNYGLRTPNGIGVGVDGEIFVTDNQGEWIPSNKLIHVKKGEFNGQPWGLPEGVDEMPDIAPPAIWLPQNEIGNSPTEPILIHNGPYKGQMLHGDVTHGGIKRDFLENIKGNYQGAVFRFSQGLEAGVNRLEWGPDSALYVGGVGMVGGWSWKEKQYGLQKLRYNNKVTFEMLAIRAKPYGFEIEFTEPLRDDQAIASSDILIEQWRYEGTQAYGGPKLDQRRLKISRLEISADRKRIDLHIPGLKKAHVVYFSLPPSVRGKSGGEMWSSEAWYTLNNIPD